MKTTLINIAHLSVAMIVITPLFIGMILLILKIEKELKDELKNDQNDS